MTGGVQALLCWQVQPIPGVAWNLEGALGKGLLETLFWLGWAILFTSTFKINHFERFGLRQAYLRLKGQPYRPVPFVKVRRTVSRATRSCSAC